MPASSGGVTERLARACAAHPRRTFLAWGLAVVGSLLLTATALHGLTSNGTVSGNPESQRANDLISRAFPSTKQEQLARFADVVVVSSARYTTGSPQFEAVVKKLFTEGRATNKVLAAGAGPASPNGHALLIHVRVGGDSDIKPIVAIVKRADRTPNFDVAITGEHTVGNDFSTLSQRDLEH